MEKNEQNAIFENKEVERKSEQAIEIKPAGIDPDILDIMKQEDFAKSMDDPKLFKRYMLNFMAENLSLMHQVEKLTETLLNVVTMVFSKDLAEYYKQAETNVKTEEKTQKTFTIIGKSHQKSKKKTKSIEKVLKID